MTTTEAKDQAAKEKGYDDFVQVVRKYSHKVISFGDFDMIINRAMQIYKTQK